MKKFLVSLASIALLSSGLIVPVSAANHGEVNSDAVSFLQNMGDTILEFDAEAAPPNRDQIELMLEAAMKAPTGLNKQPMWLTVIEDFDAQTELALTPEVRPQAGTVLFLYSYPSEEQPSNADMGISYAYLHTMAEALGYGAHVYYQPAGMLAEAGNALDYGVPEDHTPHSFVLVGLPNTADVTSSATDGSREAKYNFLAE